jgi:hypothetical protein
MSNITVLASGQLSATGSVTVELVEANETPAVVIIRLPSRPSVRHPQRFPDVAAQLTRVFAEAATQLASIKTREAAVRRTEIPWRALASSATAG